MLECHVDLLVSVNYLILLNVRTPVDLLLVSINYVIMSLELRLCC